MPFLLTLETGSLQILATSIVPAIVSTGFRLLRAFPLDLHSYRPSRGTK